MNQRCPGVKLPKYPVREVFGHDFLHSPPIPANFEGPPTTSDLVVEHSGVSAADLQLTQPMVARVNALDSVSKPSLIIYLQCVPNRLEVVLVLWPRIICFIEEYYRRRQYRNPVQTNADHVFERTRHLVVPSKYPLLFFVVIEKKLHASFVRLSMHCVNGRLQPLIRWPLLQLSNNNFTNLPPFEVRVNRSLVSSKDGEIHVLVRSGYHTEVQVDRPASGDTPRRRKPVHRLKRIV